MKKQVIRSIVIFLVIALLAACSKQEAATPKDGAEGKPKGEISRITFAEGADVSTLDPYNAVGTTTAQIIFHIFNALTRTDAEGNVEGDLAESYQALDDTTWEVVLKKGIKFQNGEDFNADAVKFSIERMLNQEKKFSITADFSFIKEVQVIDEYKVNIITHEPYPGFPLRMFYLAMVPPQYIQEKGDEYFAKNPIGTGAFKFKEWVKDDRLVLTANENYFGGAPAIDEVIFKSIPEDASRIAALEAGEIDIMSGVPTSQAARLRENKNIEVVAWPTTRGVYVGLNTLNDELLKNKKFRQALNYAVDADSIVANILDGNGKVTATNLVSQYFGFAEDVQPYPYDPEKAKQLLQEAGYNNEPLIFAVAPGSYMNAKEVAEAIAGQLKQVGVQVNVVDKENSLFRNDIMTGKIEPLYLNGIGGPYASSELIARIGYGTGQRYSTYANSEFDALRDKASVTMDVHESLKLWKQLQEMMIEEAPNIYLYQQYKIYAFNKNVGNWSPRLDEMILLHSATK